MILANQNYRRLTALLAAARLTALLTKARLTRARLTAFLATDRLTAFLARLLVTMPKLRSTCISTAKLNKVSPTDLQSVNKLFEWI